jgi:hypothetical protein
VTEGAREQGRDAVGIGYRAASWLARIVWGLTVVELPLSAALLLVIPASSGITNIPNALGAVVFAALILAFSTVGVLIATRQPYNLVGWIMLVAGFALGATVLTGTYVDLSVAQPRGRLPGTEWVAWFAQWIWVPGFAPALTFLLLLFPNGQLPSRRWRLVGWLAVAAMATLGFGMAFTPGPFVDYPKVTNPLGLTPLEGSFLEGGGVGWLLLPASVVLSASSMVVRFRRATGIERQQIKWFALAAAFAAVGWVAITLAYGIDEGTQNPLLVAAQLLQLLTFLGLALAVGIAVLKYRLYDIDFLINRTLVYGALTAMLALVYFGGVTATQAIFRTLTGQEQQPQLAVVISTLVIAALFNPLRRRIQAFIDRRFYRSKYDARKTLEAFSAKLRDETDLEELNNELVGVVRETMQPAHVSLWLRPDTLPKKDDAPS